MGALGHPGYRLLVAGAPLSPRLGLDWKGRVALLLLPMVIFDHIWGCPGSFTTANGPNGAVFMALAISQYPTVSPSSGTSCSKNTEIAAAPSHLPKEELGVGMLLQGPHAMLWHLLLPGESPWEGAGIPHGSPGCASHGRPHLSSPAGACPSELVKCLPGSVPSRATLSCNKTGKKDSCALTCASKARFLPGTGTSATTATGRGFPLPCLVHTGCGKRSGCMGRVQSTHAAARARREVVALGAHRWVQIHGMGPRCGIQPSRVLDIIPPWHSCASLHQPGKASQGPDSRSGTPQLPFLHSTESDSSYTVSCGTPVLRQGGQQRPANSSQQCLGKGAPGVPMALSGRAASCQGC